MTPEHQRLATALGVLAEDGYECRRVDDFDGAAVADFRGDEASRGRPVDVGIFMTHDALDHVRRAAKVELLRELAAEFLSGDGELGDVAWDPEEGRSSMWNIGMHLKERADKLEASGRTEGP